MLQGATAIIGVLIGFLVVGVIGIYIGDAMINAAELDENDALYASQLEIIDTFALGITLCKIIVIVSVAGIIFSVLQATGLIPAFGNTNRGGSGGF